MSDKVYGFCDAGCRRRVPSYEEFERSAAYVKIAYDATSGEKIPIQTGMSYRIKNLSRTDTWGIRFEVLTRQDDNSEFVLHGVSGFLIEYDKYSDGLKIKVIALEETPYDTEKSIYKLITNQNGQIKELDIGFYPPGGREYAVKFAGSSYGLVNDDIEVILYNEDAEIVAHGKSAYEVALDNGFEGTEEEWLESLGGGNLLFEESDGSDGLKYIINGDYAVCSSIGRCTDTEIVIASMIKGVPVTAIGDEAFMGCNTITSVKIPEGVTKIDIGAFDSCSGLREVYLPRSLKNIEEYAFGGCLLNCVYLVSNTLDDIAISEGNNALINVPQIGNWSGIVSKPKIEGEVFKEGEIVLPDLSTSQRGYAGKVYMYNESSGLRLDADKRLCIAKAEKEDIDAGTSVNKPIVPFLIRYAIEKYTFDDTLDMLTSGDIDGRLPPKANSVKEYVESRRRKVRVKLVQKGEKFYINPSTIALVLPYESKASFHKNDGTSVVDGLGTTLIFASDRVDANSNNSKSGNYYWCALIYSKTLSISNNQDKYAVGEKGCYFQNDYSGSTGSGIMYVYYLE